MLRRAFGMIAISALVVTAVFVTPAHAEFTGSGSGGGGKGIIHAGGGDHGSKGDKTPANGSSGEVKNSNPRVCTLLEPQPAAGSPLWQGHSEGAVYLCTWKIPANSPGCAALCTSDYVWSLNNPGGVDPAVLARNVFAQMRMRAITIQMTPKQTGSEMAVVRLPVWMFQTNPAAENFGPLTASDAEGGISVTVTARVTHTVFNMGDGTSVTCTTPGTPRPTGAGYAESPDCGHTYTRTSADQPGQRFRVTATTYWLGTWTASTGETGTIPLELVSAPRLLRVGEVQVLRD